MAVTGYLNRRNGPKSPKMVVSRATGDLGRKVDCIKPSLRHVDSISGIINTRRGLFRADNTRRGLLRADNTRRGLLRTDNTRRGLLRTDNTRRGILRTDNTLQGLT